MKAKRIFLYATAAALVLYGGKMALMMSIRGFRNNNPMNLKEGNNWDGETTENRDPVFEEFESPEWGIRAGGKLLLNYQRIYGLSTIAELINRFAPTNENNTQSYIDHVARQTKLGPLQYIKVADYLPELVKAIITHENGWQPYSDRVIHGGLDLIEGYNPETRTYVYA